MDPLAQFREAQKQGWAHFIPIEMFTTPTAARLIKYAKIVAGQRVLEVACGTGVVAITAARAGARVSGLDLTPQFFEMIVGDYLRNNLVRQDYLLTRAVKA